ncbi:MAG: hypothetical protein HYU52_11745 [Acidobacteria bacterium]|nr:hypothetical protein [Acidobacteriota bacterium]
MDTPRFVTHRGANILVLDYAGASASQLCAILKESEEVIRKQPQGSLLMLTRMHGYEFGSESNQLLLTHIDGNGPWACASAVVGLDHLTAVIPIANRLANRNLKAFDDEDAALDWLASQQRPAPAAADTDDAPVRFVPRDGVRILRIDFRGAGEQALLARVNAAAAIIKEQPEHSVLTLTLVHGVSYNREITSAIKAYVRGNRPYVVAGAVVGLDYLRQILLPLNRLTGRNLRAFDDEDSAVSWLAAEWRRSRRE